MNEIEMKEIGLLDLRKLLLVVDLDHLKIVIVFHYHQLLIDIHRNH
jgi:hypothetical protein